MGSYEQMKWGSLKQSLIIDALGMSTYLLPGLGEGVDLMLAPALAAWIWRLHGSAVAAGVGFFEEILPFTDIIPTATATWFYRFIICHEHTRRAHEAAALPST